MNIISYSHEEVDTSRWFLIVNPRSGDGRALLDFPHISKLMHDNEIFCEPHFTEHKSQAVEYTVKAVNEGYRKIIVVGGDGTLHEVVNGLFIQQQVDPKEITLGVIGVSIESDWMRTFGFQERNYSDMVRAIKEGKTLLQDVGVVSYEESQYRQNRYMVGVGGTGFDAEMVRRFSHRTMKKKGKKRDRENAFSYLWCVVKSFFRYKSTGVKVYLDNRLIYNDLMFSAAVGICKYNSGGVQQLPDAVVDDGLLDMTIIRPIHFWHIIFRFLYLFDGNIHRIGHTEQWRGKHIRFESIPGMMVEVDGELLGGTPLEFSVLDQAIQVIVRPEFLEERNKKNDSKTLSE